MKTWLKQHHGLLPLLLVGGVTATLFVYPYLAQKIASPIVQKQKGPTPVTTAKVSKGDLVEAYQSMGTAAGWSEIKLVSQIEGVLMSADVAPGTVVRKGQGLATLDARLLRASLEQAEASLRRSTEERSRVEQLAEKQLASQARLQTVVAQHHADKAAAERLSTQISLSQFPSPINGVVTAQHLYPGDTVRPGSALYSLADISRIRIVAKVPEHIAAHLKAGDAVSVTSDAAGGNERQAVVARVHPAADPLSHQVTVELDAGAAFPDLKPGYLVTVKFTTAARKDVLTLPRTAIRDDPAQGNVKLRVVREGHVEVRKVKLGLVLEDSVEVQKGLEAGEQVIVSGGDKLKDGAEVVLADGAVENSKKVK